VSAVWFPHRNLPNIGALIPGCFVALAPMIAGDCGKLESRNQHMRALTVAPGTANSARLEDVADPPPSDGAVLVRALALGVCGTDREIVSGAYGWAPPGEQRLVIGHESLAASRSSAGRNRLNAVRMISRSSSIFPDEGSQPAWRRA
jgi:hypothetical protein